MFYQKDLVCKPQGSGGSVTMYEFGLAGRCQTIETLKNIMRWTKQPKQLWHGYSVSFLSKGCTLYSLQVMRD